MMPMSFVDSYSEHRALNIGNAEIKYGCETIEMLHQKEIKIREKGMSLLFMSI